MFKKIILMLMIAVIVGSIYAAEPQWEDQVIYMLMLDRFANGGFPQMIILMKVNLVSIMPITMEEIFRV